MEVWTGKLTIVLVLWASVSESVVYRKEHSFAPPTVGQLDIYHNWFFTGNAEVHDGLVRLTSAEPKTEGAIWSAHPCNMKDWEIQVIFRIYGQQPAKYGNGIAIWYTKEALQLGPVFGNRDHFTGLGVFLDTHENVTHPHKHKHPYISAMINDGNMSYKHDAHGTFKELGNCHTKLRNQPPGVPTAIAVSYMQNTLSVFMDTEGLMQWVPCFTRENVILPPGYFFGISASTGWVTDFHDVITVTTLDMSTVDQALAEEEEGTEPESEVEELDAQEEVNRLIEEVRKQDIPLGPFDPEGHTHVHKEGPKKQAPPKEIPTEVKPEQKQKPQQQQTQEPKKQKVEAPQKQKVEAPKKEKVETPKAEKVEAPKKEKVEAPKKEKVEAHKRERVEAPKAEKIEEPKMEKIEAPSKMSWLKILMYTAAITIVGIFAVRWFSGYNARRKEKLSKRLY